MELRDIKEKNKTLDECLRFYEESRRRTSHEMLLLEDKCKEYKTKINAYQGNSEENSKLKKEVAVEDGKMNLIRRVQILEKQILEKERQNKLISQKIRQ